MWFEQFKRKSKRSNLRFDLETLIRNQKRPLNYSSMGIRINGHFYRKLKRKSNNTRKRHKIYKTSIHITIVKPWNVSLFQYHFHSCVLIKNFNSHKQMLNLLVNPSDIFKNRFRLNKIFKDIRYRRTGEEYERLKREVN